jgi:hypothetical protein
MELRRFVQEEYLSAFTLPGMQGVVSILPGPLKEVKRSIEKTIRAYRGNFRRLTDLVRTTIVFRKFKDIEHFLKILSERARCTPQELTSLSFRRTLGPQPDAASSTSFDDVDPIMQVIRVRNRFDPGLEDKQLFGGYRDILLKIKMAFMCVQSSCAANSVKFVPMNRWGDPDVKRLVFEIQLHLEGMELSTNASEIALHHRLYVESRNVLSV